MGNRKELKYKGKGNKLLLHSVDTAASLTAEQQGNANVVTKVYDSCYMINLIGAAFQHKTM